MQKHPRRPIWIASNLISVLFFIAIICMWIRIHQHYESPQYQLTNKQDVLDFLNTHRDKLTSVTEKPFISIPTGIFLKSFNFKDPQTVSVTGFVWQKFDSNAQKKNIAKGVYFAEANLPTELNRAYLKNYQQYQLYGWQFSGVSLHQNFNYRKYPFDTQVIWVRLWPKELYENVILTPDLNAYKNTANMTTFGIDPEFVFKDFNIKETYFNYSLENYDTNFGFQNYNFNRSYPELYFNIVIQRKFINSFILHLLPLIVVWGLLFGITLIMSSEYARAKQFGFSTNSALAALGGSFFSVLISQMNLRGNFIGQPVSYLENFYFITYLMIFLLALNAFKIAPGKQKPDILAWQNNLFSKVLFWPLLLGAITFLTYFEFFT